MSSPAPQPLPESRASRRWYIAAAAVLTSGAMVMILLGLLLAAIKISGNHIEGPQYGWNVLAFVIYAVGFAISGWGGLFAVVAAILAAVGLSKGGTRSAGIALLVVSILFSLQLFFIPVAMSTFDYFIY